MPFAPCSSCCNFMANSDRFCLFRLARAGYPSYVPQQGLAARSSEGVIAVAQCEVCGNDYDMAFEVHAQGAVHVFDSFECAIHAWHRCASTAGAR
jgi:hypothetical protein